jgi:asparagine synthetase B (glutamine-hydrolysing)
VPFLDTGFVNHAMSIRPEDRMITSDNRNIEKFILREAFADNYLPDEVLWRQKVSRSRVCRCGERESFMVCWGFAKLSKMSYWGLRDIVWDCSRFMLDAHHITLVNKNLSFSLKFQPKHDRKL